MSRCGWSNIDTHIRIYDMACHDSTDLTHRYCINSLKRFYAKHKRLPLNGKLNDMTSTTQWFVQLQNIFAAKAKQVFPHS